jgi:hypothetical protein
MSGSAPTISATPASSRAPLPALRRLLRDRPQAAERCELCAAPLASHPRHEHLLEPATHQILCSCTPCALLFPTEAERRYRRVGRRLLHLADFAMSDAQWEALALPVNIAFLHSDSSTGAVHAYYPSPVGATESLLTLEGWTDLVAANPVLAGMQPDVEALLIRRAGDAREHYLAPIDRCYELVGLIRLTWRGLSGGQEVWERIGAFFTELRRQAAVWGRGDA